MKASHTCGEGSLQAKESPLARRKWHMREGSGPVLNDKTYGCMASESYKDLRVTPGNVHVGRTIEVLCDRLAEDIITTPDTVMVDMTDWSSPIDAVRQTERKTAQSLALHGYTTAQSHVTSVAYAMWPLWYPLEYKRRARPRWIKKGAVERQKE
jgi:hypothetical protein